jgi:polyhydroxyalkanoate synthesis regulator phasin
MKKRTIFIIGGVTLLLLAILFGAFFAGPLFALANISQTTAGTPTTTTNPYCEQYLQDLAHRLNVSVSTLQQDKLAAREDVLNQLVKDGKLTQSQADAMKQRLTSRHECSGKGLYGQRAILSQFLAKYRSDIANEVALGLHLSTDQLVSQLKSGKSLNDIATAQHVSSTQLNTIVSNAIHDALSKAVSAGDLTQAQSDSFSQFLQSHPQPLDHLLNKHFSH